METRNIRSVLKFRTHRCSKLDRHRGKRWRYNALTVNKILKTAFENANSVGLILRINSPGGSPVQSALIYDEIRRLKKEHPEKKVIAVVEDVAASGGYFIASGR